jgi:hypothetical protein
MQFTVESQSPNGRCRQQLREHPLFTAVFNSRGQVTSSDCYATAEPARGTRMTPGRPWPGLAHLIANSDIAQFFADLNEPDPEKWWYRP